MRALEDIARECGFSRTDRVDAASIRVRQEVRDACAADKCRVYGKNWSCPPVCGSLEECERQIRNFNAGLILQTSGSIEDSFDYEAMSRIEEEHNKHLRAFQEKLRGFFAPKQPASEGHPVDVRRPWLLMGSGACKSCPQCTCPRSPCPSPGKMIISMEAMGIPVSELCKTNNIPYYYGPDTITFFGCMLITGYGIIN